MGGTPSRPDNIETLVFFDLESTGLAHVIGAPNVQITEVSMIAVDRNEFCQSQHPDLRDVRITQKLSMCVKPRSTICKKAAQITGLTNEKLENQETFDQNTANAIISFLSHLSKPICLLAHNGNAFDFPLLKAELGRHHVRVPSQLYVADTLVGIKALDITSLPIFYENSVPVKSKNGRLSLSLENLHVYFYNRKHFNRHSSEGDCVALAKVCHKIKDEFVPWVDKNCVAIDTITAMW